MPKKQKPYHKDKCNTECNINKSKILSKLENPILIFIFFFIIFIVIALPFFFLNFPEENIAHSQNDKAYTVSQIDINEFLYGIGKTKSEYVIMKYNKDYSNAIIFNNGKKSDGIVGINNNSSPSQIVEHPLENHKNTIKCIVINEGIISLSSDDINDGLFNNCKLLTNVKLPNTIREIGDGTFNDCIALQNIKLPNNIEKIGNLAFNNCTNLNDIKLPSKLKEIGTYCFSGCNQISEIRIPSSLNLIGGGAFEECTNLTTVFIPKEVKEIREFAFCAIGENAIIYCETEGVKQLLQMNYNYDGSTTVIIDKTKFN